MSSLVETIGRSGYPRPMRFALAFAALLAACTGETAKAPVVTPPTGSAAVPTVAAATAPKTSLDPVRPHHEMPVVECPATVVEGSDDDAKLAALLDTANKQIVAAQFGAAWTCADRAADLVPTSVEAHHLRGSALAAMGRDAEAQLAYSLALALDPDDPETLRAVADFYVNGKGDRGRDSLRLGLELAQRGSRRVQARRRRNPPLAADLALLEGQALNDLGRTSASTSRCASRPAAATRCSSAASRCSISRGSPMRRSRSRARS